MGELAQVDGGVHLVQAGYDGGGVQATDDGGADAQGQGEQELDAAQDGVLKIDKDGADGGDGDKRGDEDGYQRRHEEVEHVRHVLVQPFLQNGEDEAGDHDGDDVALVTDELDVVDAEDREVVVNALGSDGVGVLQAGVDEDSAHDRAQVGVGSERLGRGEADEDLQEGERGVGDQVRDDVERAGGIDGKVAVGVHEGQGAHDAQQKTGCDDCRDDGDKDVAQQLDGAHEGVLTLRHGLLGLFLGGLFDVAELDEFVVDLVDGAGSVDNLQLAGCLEVAFGAFCVVDGLLVYLRVVGDDQAKARCAVGGGDYVVRSSHGVEDLLRGESVIECHMRSFPFESVRLQCGTWFQYRGQTTSLLF